MILEAVRRLGLAALERTPFVETLVDTDVQGKYIVVFDLHPDPWRLELDVRSVEEKALAEVLWVGNAPGANSPQDRFTTNHPEYLASQAVPNVLTSISKGPLKDILDSMFKNAYLDLGEKGEVFPQGGGDPQYPRYRYLWNLPELGITDTDLLPQEERQDVEEICQKEKLAPSAWNFSKPTPAKTEAQKPHANFWAKPSNNGRPKSLGLNPRKSLSTPSLSKENSLLNTPITGNTSRKNSWMKPSIKP